MLGNIRIVNHITYFLPYDRISLMLNQTWS